MPIREVARFASLPEAEVACAALRASGIYALLPDRHQICMNWTHQLAFGDYRLWVMNEDLEDIRLLLRAYRAADPTVLAWTRSPGAVTGILWGLLALAAGDLGWGAGLLQRRFTFIRAAVVLLLPATYLGLLALALLSPSGS
jgi:hypothetical protein